MIRHLKQAVVRIDRALDQLERDLVRCGFPVASIPSVRRHILKARRALVDVILLVGIFEKTEPPRESGASGRGR